MLAASIDIGSNTIRLLIGNVEDNSIEHVCSERKITRLAEGIDQTGRLRERNMQASLAVLKEFSSIIVRYGVTYLKAVATSALREASNSDAFIKNVFAETCIPVEVISGEREAELILQGILASVPDSSLFTRHSLLIVDIGGGSTEWIFFRDKKPVGMGSIPVGVIKLCRSFITTDPISDDDIKTLDRAIFSLLKVLKKAIRHHVDRRTRFIGTAGTFSTLASVDLKLDTYSREKIHLHRIPLSRLKEMRRMLLSLPLRERKKVRGLEPERADLIIPGIQFTINIMEYFKFDEVMVSEHGLLEGALLETLR